MSKMISKMGFALYFFGKLNFDLAPAPVMYIKQIYWRCLIDQLTAIYECHQLTERGIIWLVSVMTEVIPSCNPLHTYLGCDCEAEINTHKRWSNLSEGALTSMF